MTEFYQGKKCKHGHSGKRYSSTRACIKCARLNSLNWQKEHPEEHSEYQLAWRRKKQIERATPRWANLVEIERIYQECERLKISMRMDLVVSHAIPLKHKRVCGLHVPSNLRVVSKRLADLQKYKFNQEKVSREQMQITGSNRLT